MAERLTRRQSSIRRRAYDDDVAVAQANTRTQYCSDEATAIETPVIFLSSPVYRAGDTVEGYVSFQVRRTILVRCIRVKCVGKERVKLSLNACDFNQRAAESSSETIEVLKSEVYFKLLQTVAGITLADERRSKDPFFIPKANFVSDSYRFPFSFKLPSKLPPSFCWISNASSGDQLRAHAQITYEIKCYADFTTARSREICIRRSFAVAMPVTSIQHRYLLSDRTLGHGGPTSMTHSDPHRCSCLCFCTSQLGGNVTLTASVKSGVIVADNGSDVKVVVTVDNRSEGPVTALLVSWRNRVLVRTANEARSQRLKESVVSTTRLASFAPVEPGKCQQIEVTVPIFPVSPHSSLPTPPTMVTYFMRSKWFISVEVEHGETGGPADECCCTVPVVVVQEVDELNRCRPVDFVDVDYETIQKHTVVEV